MRIKLTYFCLTLIYLLVNSLMVSAQQGINPVSITSKQIAEIKSDKSEGNYASKYFWVIYDNICPYCKQATKHIKSLDWEGKFKFLSYRDPETYKMFPGLSKEECEKDVHMVTPEGKIIQGYEVFRTIIDNLAATKILNPILKNDYAERKLNEIYEKMVKERSCYYNKTDACDISNGEKH